MQVGRKPDIHIQSGLRPTYDLHGAESYAGGGSMAANLGYSRGMLDGEVMTVFPAASRMLRLAARLAAANR